VQEKRLVGMSLIAMPFLPRARPGPGIPRSTRAELESHRGPVVP